MKKKLQIFISSTFTDMKEERQAAVEAILESGNIPAGMELFTSGNESQWETIKRWIDESDIYVLLLGGRYGSIDDTVGLSYTELEYNYAVSKEIPFFSIVINEGALKEKVKRFGVDVIEQIEPRLLKEFRNKVLMKTSKYYTDPKDVKLAIVNTIVDFKNRMEFSGWVSGFISKDIELLSQENQKFRKDIEDLQKIIVESHENNGQNDILDKILDEPNVYPDFEDIYKLFSKKELRTKSLDPNGITTSILTLIYIVVNYTEILMTGQSNAKMNEKEIFFFSIVFPHLEIYELSEKIGIKNNNIRYELTSKGKKFMAFALKKKYSSYD